MTGVFVSVGVFLIDVRDINPNIIIEIVKMSLDGIWLVM